jgi:hypothetical protein
MNGLSGNGYLLNAEVALRSEPQAYDSEPKNKPNKKQIA